jgi:DNA-directed RNA polymerase specialized sigma24 family protein
MSTAEGCCESQAAGATVELLRRARRGDEEALEHLVAACESQARGAVRRRLAAALEACVDSFDFASLLRRALRHGIRGETLALNHPADLAAVVCALAVRQAAGLWNQLRRDQEFYHLFGLLMSRRPEPSSSAAAAARAERIDALLRDLDDPDRRLLALHLEEHSTAEAARDLGLAADMVRVRRARLLRRARACGLDLI